MSQVDGPRLTVQEREGAIVARLLDPMILDEDQIKEIGDQIDGLTEHSKTRRLVLDFTDVKYLSSAAIGRFLGIRKKVVARDGQLRLCGLRPELRETFGLTHLDRIFAIDPDEAAALNAFQTPAG